MLIKEGIIIGGTIFYIFVISALIKDIKEQNFTKSFIRIIDQDDNGIVTKKQINSFTPCQGFDAKKLKKQFNQFGTKADLNALASMFSQKVVLKMVEGCVDTAILQDAVNPDHIKNLKKEEVITNFAVFDINGDEKVTWSEYNTITQLLKKPNKNLRSIFLFFDKNHNWTIEKKQLAKVKPKSIIDYLGSGKHK